MGFSDMMSSPPWPGFDKFKQESIEATSFEPGATIRFDRLPPQPFWVSLLGLEEKQARKVATVLARRATDLGRKLNQQEIDALSVAEADGFRYLFCYKPLGTLGALAWTYKNRNKPSNFVGKPAFERRVFPSLTTPLLKGTYATFAWHTTKFFFYLPFTTVGAGLICGTMAARNFFSVVQQDPRLQQVRQENQAKMDQVRREMGMGRRKLETPQNPHGQRLQQQQQPNSQHTDDPSRAIVDGWETQGQISATSNRVRFEQAPQPQMRQQKQLPRASGVQRPTEEPLWDDSDLFDDDASTAPSTQRAEPKRHQRTQTGSSWDRIRQQAQTGARGTSSWDRVRQQAGAQDGPPTPNQESYSYDEAEQTKSYDGQKQAQKEFDAMLERERRAEGSVGWRKSN